MLTAHILTGFLAAPPTTPTTAPAETGGSVVINTEGILAAVASTVLPLLVAALAVWIIARSKRGRVSEVVTSSGVMMWGFILFAAAGGLWAFGDDLVRVIFKN